MYTHGVVNQPSVMTFNIIFPIISNFSIASALLLKIVTLYILCKGNTILKNCFVVH